MIINVVKNSILVADENKKLFVNAYLNFERVVDSEDISGEIGIIPIFSVYVSLLDTSDEYKNMYKEFYKEILIVMGMLFPESHFINTFDSMDKIYCLKNSMIETRETVKIPTLTNMKLYKD